MPRCLSEHRTEAGGVLRCELDELHLQPHESGNVTWLVWAEVVTKPGTPDSLNELTALRAENARLRTQIARVQAKMDELAKALAVP